MIPLVAEVEPVTEGTTGIQIQVVQLCRACVSIPFLPLLWIWNSVVGSVGIERAFAKLEFVQMFVATIVRLEDGVMQLFECLVAADFDRSADFLVGELLTSP